MSRRALLVLYSCLLAVIPSVLFSYAEGPYPGYSGVPGEAGTCSVCHGGSSGSGSVSVAFPKGLTYTPGVSQNLVVKITDSTQTRWGFQLTARQAAASTTQAGTFTPGPDGFTQTVCSTPDLLIASCSSSTLQYIEHTWAGTRDGTTGSAAFQFTWTPPASGVGDVTFYVTGNAANGDGGNYGDHIYSAQYTLSAASPVTQPAITSVVNGASFQAGITAGSWVSITGTNLAASTQTWTSADMVNGALPVQLDATSVSINGNPAPVYYVSPTQLNVLAPADTNLGSVSVQVTANAQTSNSYAANLMSESPAFFLWSGKYAVATRADFTFIGPPSLFPGASTPVSPGGVVILWGTGFGPTTPAAPSGQLVPSTQLYSVQNPPKITIGGLPVTVIGAALAPGFAGLYQISIQVPASLASGDQAIVAQVGSVSSPSGVYITVQ